MSSPCKRREMDIMKLMMSDYTVEMINDGINEYNVRSHGAKESHYESGVWKVRVELPDGYPYDELSGSVCLDVINQSWSPMFASRMMKNKKHYEQKAKEYYEKYAKDEHMTSTVSDDNREDISEEDVSHGRSACSEEDVAGSAEP